MRINNKARLWAASWLLLLATPFAHARDASTAVPADQWTLHTQDGQQLQVIEFGREQAARAPVVVLHGGPGGEYGALLELVRPLADNEHVVLFDQRGSLRSPVPKDAIGFDAMVEDIETLRSQLGAERVVLLAHSMGSLLAYAYAQRHSGHVERLILVGPMLPASSAVGTEVATVYDVLGLHAPDPAAQQATQQRRQQLVQAAIARQNKQEGLTGEPRNDRERSHIERIAYAGWSIHDLSRWRQVTRDADVYQNREVYPRWIASTGGSVAFETRRAGFLRGLQKLQKPVTFIVGNEDLNTDNALWPLLVEKIPGATLVRVPAAGHMPWIDQPATVQTALRTALADTP